MLKLHWIEFFLRLIPENLLMIWGLSVIYKLSFNLKRYIISVVLLSLCVFFIRSLPIYWGIHTFIAIILITSIIFIQGIPLITSLCGTLLMFFILSLSEFFNILMLNVLGIKIDLISTNSIMVSIRKCLLGIPSLIIMFLFIKLIQYFKKQHN